MKPREKLAYWTMTAFDVAEKDTTWSQKGRNTEQVNSVGEEKLDFVHRKGERQHQKKRIATQRERSSWNLTL